MANNERIDDIISDKAFQQIDELLQRLGMAQTEFSKLAEVAAKTNQAIGQTQSVKEYNEAVKQSGKEFEKLEAQQAKITEVRQKANQQERETIEIVKGKLLSQQEETKLLNAVTGGIEGNIRANLRLKAGLAAVREEQKNLSSQTTSGATASGALAAKKEELSKKENQYKAALQQSNLELRRATKENSAAEGSYEELNARLDRLRAAYRGLSEAERNNVEVGGALLASIDENDKKLKEIDASMGVFNRNVGNYSGGVQDAIKETGLFSREMALLAKAKNIYSAGTKGATIATQSFGKALIATGIGAIIVLLGSLIAFLTSTQEGMDFVGRAMDTVSTFVGVFVDSLSTLGKQVIDNTLPVLQSLFDAAKAYINVLVGIATFDYSRIKEGVKGIKEGAIGVVDALGNIDGINLIEVGKNASQAAIQAGALRRQLQELDKEEARYEVRRAKEEKDLQRLREAANDQTLSIKERQEAINQVMDLENKMEKESVEFKKQRLAITKEQNSLTKSTEEDLQNERDLEIEIAGIEAQAARNRRRYGREAERLINESIKANKDEEKARLEALKNVEKAEFALEESRIARASERNQSVVDDEDLSYDDRISNLEQFLQNETKLIELRRDKKLADEELLESDRVRIKEEAQAELEKLARDGEKKSEAILKSQMTKEQAAAMDRQRAAIDLIKTQEAEKLTELNSQFENGLIAEQDYQNRRLQIQRDGIRAVIEEEIRGVQELIKANKLKGLNVGEEERKLAELKQKLSQETTDKTIEDLKEIEKQEKELKKVQAELQQALADLVISLVNRKFDRENEVLNVQEEQAEEQKNKEIERINATVVGEEEKQQRIKAAEQKAEQAKQQIEERRRQAQLKQARFEKFLAMAQIVQNTARAILTQLASAPLFPISGPLIPIIAAIGAAQLATVASAPIPKFEKGVKYSPEGLAIVGEKGTELIKEPGGGMRLTSDQAELTYLKKGSEVVPHEKAMKMMESDMSVWDSLKKENRRNTDILKKAITKRPERVTSITKSGIQYLYRKGSQRINYINKLL